MSLANEYKEIVQIGAIKIETIGNLKEVSSFELVVKPIKNPILSDYIVKLTRITQEKIEKGGILFPVALSHFKKFIGKQPTNILCNGDDIEVLEENCQIHSIPLPSVFTQLTDLRPYFSEGLEISQKDCISSALPELFGLNNFKKPHDALGDAKSIAQVLRFLSMKKNSGKQSSK